MSNFAPAPVGAFLSLVVLSLSPEFVRQVNARLAAQHKVIAKISGSEAEYHLWDTISGTKIQVTANDVKTLARGLEQPSTQS